MSGVSVASGAYWIESNPGLWGLLALLATVAFGIPAFLHVLVALRDAGRTTDQLHLILRNSSGRVSGPRIQNAARGTRNILTMRVRRADGTVENAVDMGIRSVSTGVPFLVLGEAGTGKSELLHQLHLASYRMATSASDPLIEVVSLAAYPSGPFATADLMPWAIRQVARRYRRSPRAIRSLVAEAKLVLAFDALDEAQPKTTTRIAHELVATTRKHPVIVTSRPLGSSYTEMSASLAALTGESRILAVHMEPLEWKDVQAELDATSLAAESSSIEHAESFTNPLHLQLLLFVAANERLTTEEIAVIVRHPDSLLARVVGGNRDSDLPQDPALRLAALAAADHEKPQGVAFRVFPFQLAGIAFRVTMIIMLACLVAVGFMLGNPVSTIVIGLGVLASTPYYRDSPLSRLLSRLPDDGDGWMQTVLIIAIGYVLTHLVRVAVWSFQSGYLRLGDWDEFLDPSWFAPIFAFGALNIVSPLGLGGALYSYGSYLATHAWPHFAAFGALIVALTAVPGILNGWTYGLAAYFATTLVYLVVSWALTWLISGIAPWHWRATLQTLVTRGVLSMEGKLFKFTHADIEHHLLWALALDTRTPGLLWRTFGAHWIDRMFSRPIGFIALRTTTPPHGVVELLGRLYAWSPRIAHATVCYHQWIALDPSAALRLVKRQLGYRTAARHIAQLPDSLDRSGSPRGLELARRYLRKITRPRYEVHWLLRVVERHWSDARMLALVERMLNQPRLSDSEVVNLLMQEAQKYRTGVSPLRDTSQTSLDIARHLLKESTSLALWHARLAQIAVLSDDEATAARESVRSIDLIDVFEGYDPMLEIMFTASVVTRDPVALAWIRRAFASGLRIRDLSGLRQRLELGDRDRDGGEAMRPNTTAQETYLT